MVNFTHELLLRDLLTSGLPHEATSQRSFHRVTQFEWKIWIATSCVFRVGDIFRIIRLLIFLCYKLYSCINIFHGACGIFRIDTFLLLSVSLCFVLQFSSPQGELPGLLMTAKILIETKCKSIISLPYTIAESIELL